MSNVPHHRALQSNPQSPFERKPYSSFVPSHPTESARHFCPESKAETLCPCPGSLQGRIAYQQDRDEMDDAESQAWGDSLLPLGEHHRPPPKLRPFSSGAKIGFENKKSPQFWVLGKVSNHFLAIKLIKPTLPNQSSKEFLRRIGLCYEMNFG